MPTVVPSVVDGDDLTDDFTLAVKSAVDELQALSTVWTSWTPVLGGVGWSLGSTGASAFGSYAVMNGTVHFHARLVFGTVGATFAAVNPTVTLPVSSAELAAGSPLRTSVLAEYVDTSAGTSSRGYGGLGTTTVGLMASIVSGTYPVDQFIYNTVPFTWAASDEIRISGWYREA